MTDNIITSAVIIGAGIFGVSTGAQLARRGIRVTILNDGPPASGASGRSLSWLNSSRMRSEPYHRLRMAGIDRYRTLSARFPDADWLRFDGGLTWDADDATNGIDAAYRHEVSLGYDARRLAADEVAAVTPGLDARAITPPGAIFNPGEGWVDLPILINLLIEEFAKLGGTLVTDQGAARVVVEGGRAVGAETGAGNRFPADAVLLATGPAVPKMVAQAGQIIEDATPVALLVQTKPLAHPLRAVLNTPRVAVRPAPGGTFSLDADWAADEGVKMREDGGRDIDAAVVDALLAEGSKVMEGNPKLEIASIGVGGKPIPGDGEPVLGALKAIPGYYLAFSHSGATLGLIVGELLAYEVAMGAEHPMLATFRPERFTSR
ncbi:FAD dependent oxidoreductase [Sinorhizobium meliloti CCNWSX0020]|jgi:glycine/D-amino acid oxidase-like deaminating enzyme|uniref:FAD dependent oxidoreductase n=2 Tax=Sinorhizobium TaxID=28105 RepID=H0FZA6_RHIML|nr:MULTISPECIES: FAD-binding oxidoreductase [Sinorhizobium]EHK77593.1 FAD dependent oxidoreductase [Sinorhizobium meliloti CCNWSX0020]RVE92292.1 FAD-binding oxidoreductase [Sinorhizobium meliloti]RVG70231.1 FAD-binding oxidoreductase [Sinorhizobium meliloti]RVH34976.1 FAD-binding oxidoreductase [Sinorhizobium meliloti]RVH37237.1 FAD-binding oxidoreductase [Sinorhizobium meliloti]